MNTYIILLSYITVICCDKIINESQSFIATNEWQVINEDQTIPQGLHVRINLSTGLKEAKLLSKDDEKKQALSLVDQPVPEEESKINVDSLKEALQNIKNDDQTVYEKKIKKKFRSLNELKENMKHFDIAMQSESDMISKLLTRYKNLGEINEENTPEVLNILQDLEYLVHNYDNGMEFVKLKGIETIILQNIGNRTDDIIINTLELLGACMQNNQNVQQVIFSYNIGQQILKLIEDGTNTVKTKAIYALGCLTRRYPYAQQKLIIEIGHDIINKILNDFKEPSMKVKIKIITLLNDLISEQSTNYETLLSNINFCKTIRRLILHNCKYFPEEHDNNEKLLVALNVTLDSCKDKVAVSNSFKTVMRDLTEFYFELTIEEQTVEDKSDRGYFTNMLALIDSITKNLNVFDKTEL